MNTTKLVFLRHRTLEELRAAVMAEGWKLEEALFNQGDDSVSFHFQIGRTKGICIFNTFNGKFCGSLDGTGAVFSSSNSEHDNCRWFQKLLTVCLVAEEPKKPATAYGHEVDIEISIGAGSSKTVTKHWRLKHASMARSRGMQESNALGVVAVRPLTEEQWAAAYGVPCPKVES